MANKNNKNNDTQSQPKPRSGFNATAFIKKQLERSKPAEGTKPVSEIVTFPITSESQPVSIPEEKELTVVSTEIMNRYLAVAEEHLASGALWEAVGVYRAVLKLDPENLSVRNKLIKTLLKNNANQEAVKELLSLAELEQKQDTDDTGKQTYQQILELDPGNAIAKSALGIPEPVKEEVFAEELVPVPAVEPITEEKPVEVEVLFSTEPQQPEPEIVAVQEPVSPVAELEPVTELTPITEKVKPEEPSGTEELVVVSEPTVSAEPVIAELQPEPIPETTNGKLEYFRKILESDPKDIPARLGYINTYLEVGLEFELIPEYLALAEAHLDTSDLAAAEKTYRHILELELDQPGAMQGLVAINKKRSETTGPTPSPTSPPAPIQSPEEKLIDNYRRILQLNPLNSDIAHRLAALYRKRNESQMAVAELSQLGDAYMQRSMYSPAIKVYQEALEIEEKNQELKKKLVKAQELQQSMTAIDSAIKSYKTGLDYGPIKRSP